MNDSFSSKEDKYIKIGKVLAVLIWPLVIILFSVVKIERKILAEGTVFTAKQMTVRSLNGPTLTGTILVQPGDTVTNGQPIIHFIDSQGYGEQMKLLELESKRIYQSVIAFSNFHSDELHKLSKRTEYESLLISLEQARTKAKAATERYNNLIARAPFDGEIINLLVKEYDPVETGTALFEIAERDNLFVRIYIPESTYILVTNGLKTYVKSHMYNYLWYRIFGGKIVYVSNFAVKLSELSEPQFEVHIKIIDGEEFFRVNGTATCEIVRDKVSILNYLLSSRE